MISKEIILRVGPEEVWHYINSDELLSELWHSKIKRDSKNRRLLKLVDTGDSVKITKLLPPNLISFFGGYGTLPLTTTMAISEKRIGTALKISVSGWENIDSNELRHKVPILSYEWEERLTSMKKSIESRQFPAIESFAIMPDKSESS
ncbi:MAG: hypothetical protein V3W18_08875 [candidate division Zixibacteria bacterium]